MGRSDRMVQARKVLIVLMGGLVLLALAFIWHRSLPVCSALSDRLASIYPAEDGSVVPCPWEIGDRPLMILVLGQSNAGNHGATPAHDTSPALFFYQGRCYLTAGPAPGATGKGGNIWTYLSPLLSTELQRPVVFSVLAVDATSITEWTAESALRELVVKTIRQGKAHGFIPELVLWQQGEADARSGMSGAEYRQKLDKLRASIRNELERGAMIVAQSTRCRNEGSEDIRRVLGEAAEGRSGVILGPDTDALQGDFRLDGCHFSLSGLKAASSLWASVIVSALVAPGERGHPLSASKPVGAI